MAAARGHKADLRFKSRVNNLVVIMIFNIVNILYFFSIKRERITQPRHPVFTEAKLRNNALYT